MSFFSSAPISSSLLHFRNDHRSIKKGLQKLKGEENYSLPSMRNLVFPTCYEVGFSRIKKISKFCGWLVILLSFEGKIFGGFMSNPRAAPSVDINPPQILPSKLCSITNQPQNFLIFIFCQILPLAGGKHQISQEGDNN